MTPALTSMRPDWGDAPAWPSFPCARGKARGAFTMIELIVIIVLIGILAGLVIPRLVGTASRQAEVEVQAVRDLLGQAAQRDALTNDPLAVAYDSAARSLSVLVERSDTSPTGASGTASTWVRAPLSKPVNLYTVELAGATVDGQAMTHGGSWRAEFRQSGARPSLSILLQLIGTAERWQVDLVSGQLAAKSVKLAPMDQWRPSQGRGIDLDAAGRREEAW